MATITSCLILQELAMKILTTCVENTYYMHDEHACVKICSTNFTHVVSISIANSCVIKQYLQSTITQTIVISCVSATSSYFCTT